MKACDTSISSAFDRIHGLMAWWGMDRVVGPGQAKQYELLVADLVRVFEAASANQVNAMSAANERLARAFQDLAMARKPPELASAQTRLVVAILESFGMQAKIWTELTHNVSTCCSAMLRERGAEPAEHTDRCEAVGRQVEAERPDQRPKPRLDPQSKLLDRAHG